MTRPLKLPRLEVFASLYNTEKKELIGVFRNLALVSRYLFPNEGKYKYQRVYQSYSVKCKIHKGTIFNFPVTLRIANEKHLDILGDKDVYICPGYPDMSNAKIFGMKPHKK